MRYTAIALVLLTSSALAQEKPPAFVPYTITQQEHDQLLRYMAQQPYVIAEPVVIFLRSKLGAAQKAEADKAKEPEKKEPTPK